MNTKHVKVYHRLFILLVFLTATWQLGSAAYIHVKAIVAQQLLQSAWDKTLQGEKQVKPWGWADTWPIARMQVPAYNEDMIVLAGDSGRNLAFGPAYRFGSAEPGRQGVSLISAHRDTHFRFLKDIIIGDKIKIHTDKGELIIYEVMQTEIVSKADVQIELGSRNKELILVTCYPFNNIMPDTDLRYLVYAKEVQKIS